MMPLGYRCLACGSGGGGGVNVNVVKLQLETIINFKIAVNSIYKSVT